MSAAVFPIDRTAPALSTESRRAEATRWIAGLHDELTSFFGRLDRGGTFIEDRWERPGGGGGDSGSRFVGGTFERALALGRASVGGVGETPKGGLGLNLALALGRRVGPRAL